MPSKIIVLKFGSSILREPADLPDAVHEIFRYVRRGYRVIAVVSAFSGATSALLQQNARFGREPEPHALASCVATGEQVAAAQLTMAAHQYGIPIQLCDPASIGLTGFGPPLESDLCGVDAARLRHRLETVPAIVIPGYFAFDDQMRCILLGRGGSDNTALFLGQALNAECVLVKDVPGLFEQDPSQANVSARRFHTVSWSDASKYAGRLVQPKALAFARTHAYPFRISALSSPESTRVAGTTRAPMDFGSPPPAMRVVVLGLGKVGLAIYRELARRPRMFDVKCIVVRSIERPREPEIPLDLLGTDAESAAGGTAHLVVDALPGAHPACEAVTVALNAGRSVVSGNRDLLARYRDRLVSRGIANGAFFGTSAVGDAAMCRTLPWPRTPAPIESHMPIRARAVVNGIALDDDPLPAQTDPCRTFATDGTAVLTPHAVDHLPTTIAMMADVFDAWRQYFVNQRLAPDQR